MNRIVKKIASALGDSCEGGEGWLLDESSLRPEPPSLTS